jgi:hypothetical protein
MGPVQDGVDMNTTISAPRVGTLPPPALAAYAAVAAFVVLIVMFAGVLPPFGAHPPLPLLLFAAVDAIAFHLLLFPVIAALPAPDWGRAAGYGWLVVDIATSVMTVNGVPFDTTTALRLGGHIAACLWVASAAWSTRGWTRGIGFALVVALGLYSFIAPYVPAPAIMPAMLLLTVWVVISARRLQAAGR